MSSATNPSFFERLLRVPVLIWALAGLLAPYLVFFIPTIFFSSAGPMQFPEYVPKASIIGVDLLTIVDVPRLVLRNARNPYINFGQYAYPPFNMLEVLPLAPLSASQAYVFITFVNIGCAILLSFALPLLINRPRPLSQLLPVALLTGLFSYGFQFELERGQFNLIAMSLTLVAAWIFHARPKWRPAAYMLFTLGVQLKVFPFIFILLLIDDWRAWRDNLRRFIWLGVVNFVLLFIFGPNLFASWLAALVDKSINPYVWPGNHSIRSFVNWQPTRAGWEWLAPIANPVALGLMLVVAGCFGLLVWRAFRRRRVGIDPWLVLGCTLFALTIPSDSHDYTLSFLVAPVALLFAQPDLWTTARSSGRRFALLALLTVFTAAYGMTLLSYAYKPPEWYNNCLPLIAMLLAGTAAAWLSEARGQAPAEGRT